QALDGEMAERIALHVRERGDDFRTVEEPLDLAARLSGLGDADVVVIDCLTLWLANRLLGGEAPGDIERAVRDLARVLAERRVRAPYARNARSGFNDPPGRDLRPDRCARCRRVRGGAASPR